MKKFLLLLLFIPLLSFGQTEEYSNGRLLKTLSKSDVYVTTSLNSISKDSGKYYVFNVSISNKSQTTKLVKVSSFKAYIFQEKKKRNAPLKIISSKEFLKKKERKDLIKNGIKRFNTFSNVIFNAKDVDAGTSSSTSTTSASSYSTTNSTTDAQVKGDLGSLDINANTNSSTSKNSFEVNNTESYDGQAAYAARQNEERKLEEYRVKLEKAREQWNDNYLKSETLDPYESVGGLLNLEYKKGEMIYFNIKVSDLDFVFKWSPDESEF